MASIAESLATWAYEYVAGADDFALAQRSLVDTLAVALAARGHPVQAIAAGLPEATRWAVSAHVLDYDDLHLDSTSHVSVIVVPAVLAAGGGARAYLAGAGVMARLGTLLGWRHYSAGWHATCTAGAPAAAVAAGVALGLRPPQLATAMALAVPAAGGVQAAFGTHGKSLQVGFAVQAGVRAARLAQAGATADPRALDAWLPLVGGRTDGVELGGPAVPGGLAVKLFPCCYALQRPIAALRAIRDQVDGTVTRVLVRTPEATVQPLIHAVPTTGLEGKFSMEYAVATALLDEYPGLGSFTDEAVNRTTARQLVSIVELDRTPGGDGLLHGKVAILVQLAGREPIEIGLGQPPGAPRRPPSDADVAAKLAACGHDVPRLLAGITWEAARELMRSSFPGRDIDAA